jgi:hypothetical protein
VIPDAARRSALLRSGKEREEHDRAEQVGGVRLMASSGAPGPDTGACAICRDRRTITMTARKA